MEFRQPVARDCSAGVATVGCGRAPSDGHDRDERETWKAREVRAASAALTAAGLQPWVQSSVARQSYAQGIAHLYGVPLRFGASDCIFRSGFTSGHHAHVEDLQPRRVSKV